MHGYADASKKGTSLLCMGRNRIAWSQLCEYIAFCTLAPLVVQVQQHWHLQYQALDIGSAPASITAFSLPFAPLLLPLLLGINLILVRKQWVQTLHIDLFNYWFYLITAGFAYQVSGSLATAILAALAHSVITLLLADYSAEQVCSFTGMNNISVPHGFAAATIPLLLGLNRLFMRILPKKHTRKVGRIAGIWNNPACIGLLLVRPLLCWQAAGSLSCYR